MDQEFFVKNKVVNNNTLFECNLIWWKICNLFKTSNENNEIT